MRCIFKDSNIISPQIDIYILRLPEKYIWKNEDDIYL